MNRNVVLIGGGRMGRAMIQGMLGAGVLEAERLVVVERDESSRQWWTENVSAARVVPAGASSGGKAVADSEAEAVVLLAVKPQQISEVIAEVRAHQEDAWASHLVVSVAAGVRLDQLTDWLGSRRVARVMPNTPALVGAAASAYCCADGVQPRDEADLRAVLDAFGTSVSVPEYQMDAVTGLSGSGPAYVFMFIEALADGGVLAGLPRETAMRLAVQTVRGAAEMVARTELHPGVLKDQVASPGGTTIAAISTLEQNAFRGAVIRAVQASAERSRQLSGGQ